MVMFFEWHQSTMDPKSSSCLPLTGEDSGLGASASPLAGYLGKVLERASSLEYCPWCTSKGFTYALRSYRINLQESIILCTNPQCLFPLVSQPLEDVLASLDPVEPTDGNKRKNSVALEKEELTKPPLKRLRSSNAEDLEPLRDTDGPVSPAEQCAVNPVRNGLHATPENDGKAVHGCQAASPDAKTTGWTSPQNEMHPDREVQTGDPPTPTYSASVGHLTDALSLTTVKDESALSPHFDAVDVSESGLTWSPEPTSKGSSQDICSTNISIPSTLCSERTKLTEEKSLIVDIPVCKNPESIRLESEDLSCSSGTESDKLLFVPKQLLWSNCDNLCWLDSLLAALVTCKSLKCKPEDEPQQSSVWQLMKTHEAIHAAVQEQQRIDKDGVAKVPSHVLHKANADLQSLRMSVFKQLQPKLHCKLGQRETPVFAMPLLLTMDSWVERLFQTTFHWEFKCSECKVTTKERIVKTLPTFTNIVPNWHPLHAAHFAPCNVCSKKNQMRTMLLQRVPPVFALHFVDGLPHNDVSIYSFSFNGKCYSITTVIQYNQQIKHFVTWLHNNDGSWLEYDDLKHPDYQTHQELLVPAHEMHVVFWEVEDDAEPSVCSPSTTFVEPPSPETNAFPSLYDEADEPLALTPHQSLLMPDDTDIVCALSGEGSSNNMDTTITAKGDESISATTLLDTFEGLTHSDIITLTLVEVKADSETQILDENQQTQRSSPARIKKLDSTVDSSSSSNAADSDICRNADPPTNPSSPDTEPKDGSCEAPAAKRGQGRRTSARIASRKQTGKKAASSKAAPHTSPPASSEPSEAVTHKPESPAEAKQQPSPVSSTNTSPPSSDQKSAAELPALDQSARWCFLLSKHPLNQVHKSIAKLAPTPTETPSVDTRVKRSPPVHSTPNPLKGQSILPGLAKQQLSTEDGEGLPPKAAEMYGGFGRKVLCTESPLAPPGPFSEESKHFKPGNSTSSVTSGVSCLKSAAKQLPEICLSKHSSQSFKVPPGLSDTDALRYKLIRKLKAKKKKLAKLNNLLGYEGRPCLQPDSTDLNSPSTVTSSTYDGSTCDDFLSELLSPATTVSNLSPDSTDFLEMLASGKDGAKQLGCSARTSGAASQASCGTNGPDTENFLEDFLSQL